MLYEDSPSRAWLAHERARLECLAIDNELAVDIRKRADGKGFDFKFQNVVESARFQALAWGDAPNHGAHRHRESFEGDVEYQEAWTSYASRAMNELGIRCDIETEDRSVEFKFDTAQDWSLFVHFRDAGMFDDMVNHPEEFEFKRPLGYTNPGLN